MTQEERTYKHKIPANVFVEAVTASDEEFEKKKDKYKKLGIDRIEGSELRKRPEKFPEIISEDKKYTLIVDAEIEQGEMERITLKGIKSDLPSVVFVSSMCPGLEFSDCKIEKTAFIF
jgi:hypothetical protein